MEIVLTGTGTALPDPARAGPSTLIKVGGNHILIDAGRGTVMRLAATGTSPAMLNAVCVTHLHSDHVCAINDVITTHWMMSASLGRDAQLRIFGPPGTARFVERSISALEDDVGYRIAHHEHLTEPPKPQVTELAPGDMFSIGSEGTADGDGDGDTDALDRPTETVQVLTAATVHTPAAPTIGFRFEHDGVAATLVGDTVPCVGVDALCANADAYVQTVVRDDLVRQANDPLMRDTIDYHSSLVDAAQTAKRAHVKRLVLTHLIPSPSADDYDDWRSIAAKHFDGEIVIGDDLTSVVL